MRLPYSVYEADEVKQNRKEEGFGISGGEDAGNPKIKNRDSGRLLECSFAD